MSDECVTANSPTMHGTGEGGARVSPHDASAVTHLHVRLLCVSKRTLAFSLCLKACPTTRVLSPTTTAFHEEGSTYLALARSQERSRRPITTDWITTLQTTHMAPGTWKRPALPKHAYRQAVTKHHTLDENGIETACPLDDGEHKFKRHKYDLGILEGLPDEILLMALVELDIRTLTDFRRLNKRAMQIVNSIPEYNLVLETCPNLIRGLLSTGLGSQFSCKDLAETLTGYECETCGDFAGYTNIFTCKRVCFLCFTGISREPSPEYYPLTASEAARKFGVPRAFFASVPSLKSIPGTYTCDENVRMTRLTLFDHETARRMSIEHHGSAEAMEKHVAERSQKTLEAYERRVEQGNYAVRGLIRAGLDGGSVADARRYMAIVHTPWVVKRAKTVERGFHCGGCRRQWDTRSYGLSFKKYCAKTFEDHVTEFGALEIVSADPANGIHAESVRHNPSSDR
jgi:hypothetical protein